MSPLNASIPLINYQPVDTSLHPLLLFTVLIVVACVGFGVYAMSSLGETGIGMMVGGAGMAVFLVIASASHSMRIDDDYARNIDTYGENLQVLLANDLPVESAAEASVAPLQSVGDANWSVRVVDRRVEVAVAGTPHGGPSQPICRAYLLRDDNAVMDTVDCVY